MKDINIIMDVFVKRFKEYLNISNIKVTQVAKDLNIPLRTLYTWLEKTRVPKIDALYSLADYLKVSIDYLVGREN